MTEKKLSEHLFHVINDWRKSHAAQDVRLSSFRLGDVMQSLADFIVESKFIATQGSAIAEREWRPKHSVPLDGRFVDLWARLIGDGPAMPHRRITGCTYRRSTLSPGDFDSEWLSGTGERVVEIRCWMPLPPIPTPTEGADNGTR